MSFFILNLLLVIGFALSQLNHFFVFRGVQPNLALVAILVFALSEKDWLRRSIVILSAVLTLIFEPSLGPDTLITAAVFFLAVFLLDMLKWQPAVNFILAVLIATALINLDTFRLTAVLGETALDLLWAGPLVLLMRFLFVRFKV